VHVLTKPTAPFGFWTVVLPGFLSMAILCRGQTVIADRPASAPELSPFLGLVGDGFRITDSAHFRVASDVEDELVRAAIVELESTFDAVHRFGAALNLTMTRPATPLPVIYFAEPEAFEQSCQRLGVAAPREAGIYDPKSNLVLFYDLRKHPDVRPEVGGNHVGHASPDAKIKPFARLVMRHESGHQILNNSGVVPRGAPIPAWLAEGLACQFEFPQAGPGQSLPPMNPARCSDFRKIFALADGETTVTPERLQAAWQAKRWLAVVDLCGDSEAMRPDGEHAPFRYAQAWALVYYLRHRHAREFADYLRSMARREPDRAVPPHQEIAVFESAFGRWDSAAERTWIDFILKSAP
jgi:hypothetical protein